MVHLLGILLLARPLLAVHNIVVSLIKLLLLQFELVFMGLLLLPLVAMTFLIVSLVDFLFADSILRRKDTSLVFFLFDDRIPIV